MKHALPFPLLASGLILLRASAVCGQAVSPLLVGQPGGIYREFWPPKDIQAPAPIDTWVLSVRDSLDVDQDGRTDLRFQTSTISYGASPSRSGFSGNNNHIRLTNPNLELAASTWLAAALPLGDTLQPSFSILDPRYAAASSAWSSLATSATYTLSGFSRSSGYGEWGMFLSGTKYLGIRLRAGNAWRYGWVRITMIDPYNSHYQVEAYALQAAATPLAALPAQVAAAWQVYPLPATDRLNIQAPPAGTGRLTLLDGLGRMVTPAVELTSGKTTELELTGLPAGLYLLRVQTPAGSFVRRVAKR